MNKICKIEVTSTRKYSFAKPGSPSPTLEDLEEAILSGDLPEELFETDFSDRPDDAAFFDPAALFRPTSSTLTSYGVFNKEEDGSIRISYEDSDATGLNGCLTTFCLSPSGMLIFLRRGEIRTCMIFEKGKRHLCDYGTAGEIPSVVLHTHQMKADLKETGGTLFVDYSVEIRGIRTERNELSVLVTLEN